MTKKNTQNADAPRIKEPRQYKHTPSKRKRLTSKIFALLACMLLLCSFVLPVFADGWQEATLAVVYAHPYAPDSITVNTSYYDASYTIPQCYPIGNPNAQNGSSSTLYINGTSKTLGFVTSFDDRNIKVNASNNTNLSPAGQPSRVSIGWQSFSYSKAVFDEYFIDSMCTIRYNTAAYLVFGIEVVYFDPSENGYVTVYTDGHTTQLVSQEVSTTISGLIRSAFTHAFDIPDQTTIQSMTFSIYPSGVANGSPSTSARWTAIETTAPAVSNETDPASLGYGTVGIPPSNVDGSSLFDWLGDSLSGVLSTPLIPLGADLSLSLGGVLAVVIGVSLLFAFMKLFAGG